MLPAHAYRARISHSFRIASRPTVIIARPSSRRFSLRANSGEIISFEGRITQVRAIDDGLVGTGPT
jgi:hypothetical protein